MTLQALVASALAGGTGIFAFGGAMAVTGSWPISLPIAVAIAAGAGALCWWRPPVPLDPRASSRSLAIVSGLATIAALGLLARLCVFIVDPTQVGCAIGNTRGLGLAVTHSCLSAYVVAGEAVDTTPNVYDDALYSLPNATPGARRRPRTLGLFLIDVYEYPPPVPAPAPPPAARS